MTPTNLFKWTLEDGTIVQSDEPPTQEMPVVELILHRNIQAIKDAGLRPNMSFPVHEQCMLQLPHSLRILRITGCRIRTFPILPSHMLEFYAEGCDFFTLPDLSHLTELILMSFKDNRLEQLIHPLPPNLTVLQLENNAIHTITCEKPETLEIGNITMLGNVKIINVWGHTFVPVVYNTRTQHVPNEFIRNHNPVRPVHEDTQNVHDHGVQKSAQKNLDYICNYKFPAIPIRKNIVDIISKDIKQITNKRWYHNIINPRHTRILRELKNRLSSTYSMHGYTLQRILDRMWLRMMDLPAEKQNDCMQRFVEEVEDSMGHCTNGFATRMQNVFIGFDNNIEVKLEPSTVIQTRIPAIMARIRKEKGYTEGQEPYEFWVGVINATWDTMNEIEMDRDERNRWLYPMFEEIINHKQEIQNTDPLEDHYTTIGITNDPNLLMMFNQW